MEVEVSAMLIETQSYCDCEECAIAVSVNKILRPPYKATVGPHRIRIFHAADISLRGTKTPLQEMSIPEGKGGYTYQVTHPEGFKIELPIKEKFLNKK